MSCRFVTPADLINFYYIEYYFCNYYRNSDVTVMTDSNTPIRIENSGKMIWELPRIFETYCEMITHYYPFDTQNCDITLTSWGYTSGQITLVFNDEPIVKTYFRENDAWDISNTTTEKSDKARAGESYSQLVFILSLERRPFFTVLNYVFPVMLFSLLSCYAFKLPIDSGERMGYSLTVLLVYVFYLMLVTDSMPATSKHTSYFRE